MPPQPLNRGLPPPDPRSLCPQLNLLNPPPEQNSWVRHWQWERPLYLQMVRTITYWRRVVTYMRGNTVYCVYRNNLLMMDSYLLQMCRVWYNLNNLMRKRCILLVCLTYMHHDARFWKYQDISYVLQQSFRTNFMVQHRDKTGLIKQIVLVAWPRVSAHK